MATMEKPKSITITVGDRKEGKYESFVVYGTTIDETVKKIKKTFGND